jgi:uncharacterized protein
MMKVWNPTEKEIRDTESWGTWSKEVSEFQWSYDDTETCLILEGAAFVRDTNGNTVEFKKGDMVRFEKGLSCTWKITDDLRKKYKFS